MTERVNLGMRLAIRHEGDMLNAYLADATSMKDARLIGAVAAGITKRQDLYDEWKSLMTKILQAAIEDVYGETPMFHEREAPESERGGHG